MKPLVTRTGVAIGGAYEPPRDPAQAEHHRRVRGLSAHQCPSAQPHTDEPPGLMTLATALAVVITLVCLVALFPFAR